MRWSEKDDLFLAEWAHLGIDLIAVSLGRSGPSAKNRVAYLKKCGAWDILQEELGAHQRWADESEARLERYELAVKRKPKPRLRLVMGGLDTPGRNSLRDRSIGD